jgi:hypothetical protein
MLDWLFGNAKTHCRHAILSDEYASRYDQGCLIRFRKIHDTLERIEKKLPPNAPGSTTAGIDRTLTYMKQHAERTIEHLDKLDKHLLEFEQKLDNAKR